MAKNLMSAIAGLSEAKPDADKAKSKAKKPKVVNLGKGGSFTIKHPGGLHAATHTPAGEKISQSKIEAASHSRDAHVRRMAASAKGLEAMHHGGKK